MSNDEAQAIPGAAGMPDGLVHLLLERYREPHRRYHDDRHLAAVLAAVELLGDHADDLEAVRLAAWFHDAAYEPTRSDNEEVSAQLAEGLLPLFDVPPPRIAEVARLVRLTGEHAPTADDANGDVLCDADLAVLAGDPDAYADYAAGIRTEYVHVDDADFNRERGTILRELLARPRLFHTDRAYTQWEKRARANIAVELQLLNA